MCAYTYAFEGSYTRIYMYMHNCTHLHVHVCQKTDSKPLLYTNITNNGPSAWTYWSGCPGPDHVGSGFLWVCSCPRC